MGTHLDHLVNKAREHEDTAVEAAGAAGGYTEIVHAILSMGYRIAAAVERASQ